MKKACIILFIVSLILLSCKKEDGDGAEYLWTLSGTVRITNSSTIDDDVKLAAFYGGETLHENSPMVSNLINVGQVKDVSVDFSITIDVRNYSPTTAHRIYVFMWEDDNGDNLFDDGESNSEAEGISGCDVFGSGVPAAYYWDGLYWTSWANGNPEVDSDTYTGARLENKYDL